METRTVGELKIVTPDLDPSDLDPVREPPDDDLSDASAEDQDWSGLELAGARIDGSLLAAVDLKDASWRYVTLHGCRLERLDLSGAGLTGLTVERCEFVGCRLTGTQIADSTFKDVVFEDCRFDYAHLDRLRTTGPTAWVGCSLANAVLTNCRLPTAAVHECRLTDLELKDCDLRGTDLRGNDLSRLNGMASLAGATVETAQLLDLATLAARDLRLDVREPG